MKKRIISMLLAFAMVASLVPVVAVPATAATLSHNVAIALRSTLSNEAVWTSDPIKITGPGTYKGTVTVPRGEDGSPLTDNLVGVSISTDVRGYDESFSPFSEDDFLYTMCNVCRDLPTIRKCDCDYAGGAGFDDPRVPEEWAELVTKIDKIVVNGNIELTSGFENHFRRRDDPKPYVDFVHMELWNGWWEPHNTLTPVSPYTCHWEAQSFRLAGGTEENPIPIETFEVEFTVYDPATVQQKPALTAEQGAPVRLIAQCSKNTTTLGTPVTITGDGEFSATLTLPAGTEILTRLSLVSDGGDFSPVTPFWGKASPAPEAWREKAFMSITSVQINSNNGSTARWGVNVNKDIDSPNNSLLIVQPPADGSFSPMGNYIDVPLWNGFHEPSRILLGFMEIPYDMGNSTITGLGLTNQIPMTSVTVNFKIEGLSGSNVAPDKCDKCGEVDPCGNAACGDTHPEACGTCKQPLPCGNAACVDEPDPNEKHEPAYWAGSGFVTAESRRAREANPEAGPEVGDALQILRYAVDLSNVITGNEHALKAALIVSTDKPEVGDALQILRSAVGLPNEIKAPGA